MKLTLCFIKSWKISVCSEKRQNTTKIKHKMHCLNSIISTITVLSKSINIYWSSLSHLASFGSFSIKVHLNNSMVFFWMSSFLNVPLSTLAISSLAPLMVYSTHLTVSLVTSMSLFNIGTVLNLSWSSSYCTFSNLFFFLPFFFLSFISLPFSHQYRQNMIIKENFMVTL